MTSPSRSAQFAKLQKSLKKFYKPVAPNPERPVLEQLLYASCLENAHYEKADEAYASLVHTFFDWNEIRVTTTKELAESMAALPDPLAAATRVRRVLQNVFEGTYTFDLEDLRKKNLGVAVERLEKMSGTTRFTVAYVVQSALGGHSIPLDAGALGVLEVLGIATAKDVADGAIGGLERAIAKNKGVEFGALLHQLGADFIANPYSTNLHKTLVQIEPDAESRLPKRRPKEPKPEPVPVQSTKAAKPAKGEPAAVVMADDGKSKAKKKKGEEAVAVEAPKPAKGGEAKTAEAKSTEKPGGKPAPEGAAEKRPAGKAEKAAAAEHKPAAAKATAESKAEAGKKKAVAPPAKKPAAADAHLPTGAAKRSAASGLSKRKPR
jgi:hypothetical protein